MEGSICESCDDCADVAIKIETVVKVTDSELAGVNDSDAVVVKLKPVNLMPIVIKPEYTGEYLRHCFNRSPFDVLMLLRIPR